MGADGGSLPTRDELVKTKEKRSVPDKVTQLATKYRFCALSSEPLVEPILSCAKGLLYNSQPILEFLLDRTKYGEQGTVAEHIKNRKDVVTLKFTPTPTYDKRSADQQSSPFCCPISNLELSGVYPFVYLPCGCVFSEKGLREVKSTNCLNCNVSYDPADVVVINGTADQQEAQMLRHEARRAAAKEAKKDKKEKKDKGKPINASATSATSATALSKPIDQTLPARSKRTAAEVFDDASYPQSKASNKDANPTSLNPATSTSSVYKSLFLSAEEKQAQFELEKVTYMHRGHLTHKT